MKFSELTDHTKISNMNDIKLGDKLHLVRNKTDDVYNDTVTKINRLIIDAAVDKDYGNDNMILITRKKRKTS